MFLEVPESPETSVFIVLRAITGSWLMPQANIAAIGAHACKANGTLSATAVFATEVVLEAVPSSSSSGPSKALRIAALNCASYNKRRGCSCSSLLPSVLDSSLVSANAPTMSRINVIPKVWNDPNGDGIVPTLTVLVVAKQAKRTSLRKWRTKVETPAGPSALIMRRTSR